MKKVFLIIILFTVVFCFSACNLDRSRIMLINKTQYTVSMDYWAGSKADGSDDFRTVEIAPESEVEIEDAQLWLGDSNQELLTHGCRAVDSDVDIDMDEIPGTYLWPLTVIFTVDE